MPPKKTESAPAEVLVGEVPSRTGARAGEVLDDKYELLRKVGEGGMGEVYEARHRVLNRRFAVKLLHAELLANERMLRRFSREVLAVSQLENDHLVPALDCGRSAEGIPYYVMEFLRGSDLRRLLRAEAPLVTQRAVRLVIDACRGLMVAHERGLVHRDLKPENVFVVRSDNGDELGKVLDFGLVQLSASNSETQLGALVGTVRYMAPEQARADRRVDRRADVYALGAILYECLTGQPPHAGASAEEVLFQRMNAAPRSLTEQRPELSSSLVAVVQRALASDPDARYGSVLELSNALLPFAGPGVRGLQISYALRPPDDSPSESSAPTIESDLPDSKPAGPLRWVALGSASTALVAGALHFAYAGRPPAAPPVTGGGPNSVVSTPAISACPAIPQASVAVAAPPEPSESARALGAPVRAAHASDQAPAARVPRSFFDHENPYEHSPRSP